MAQTVSATAQVVLNVTDAVTGNTVAAAGDVMGVSESVQTTFNAAGGTAPTVALQWSAPLTFVGSTPQTLDLTSLTGPRGSVVTFASIRLLYLINLATTTAWNLTVGAGGANSWFAPLDAITDTYAVPPGSRLLWENADPSAPWAVDGTHKLLKLDPGTHAVTARVIVVGS